MKKICLISLLSESGFKSLTMMWLAESGRIINVSGMVIIARFSNWLIVYTCCLQIYLLIRKILGKSSTNFLGNEFCTFLRQKGNFCCQAMAGIKLKSLLVESSFGPDE